MLLQCIQIPTNKNCMHITYDHQTIIMQLLEKSRLNSRITYFRNDVLPGQYEGSKKIVSTIISNFRYRHLQ